MNIIIEIDETDKDTPYHVLGLYTNRKCQDKEEVLEFVDEELEDLENSYD